MTSHTGPTIEEQKEKSITDARICNATIKSNTDIGKLNNCKKYGFNGISNRCTVYMYMKITCIILIYTI